MIDRFFYDLDRQVQIAKTYSRLNKLSSNQEISLTKISQFAPKSYYGPAMSGLGNCRLSNAEIKESFKELYSIDEME